MNASSLTNRQKLDQLTGLTNSAAAVAASEMKTRVTARSEKRGMRMEE